MNIAEQLRTNLKKYREAAHMNSSELARRSGVSRTHIGQIEHGESIPTIEIVQQLATALGISIEALIGGETKEVPKPVLSRQTLRELRVLLDWMEP